MKNIPKKLLNIKTEWKLHQKMHILKGSGSNSPVTEILGQIWFCGSVLLDIWRNIHKYWQYQTISVETNIIDCRHLNERQWIKVIAGSTVACVGNGWRRIIRHEYSARHSRSPLLTGQSSNAMYGNRARRKSVIEICREIRHWNPSENVSRNLISAPVSGEIGEERLTD